MQHRSFLAIQHKTSLAIGGIVRYRIKLLPSQVHNIESLQFRVRNGSSVLRNLTPASGPWKISVALIRNPDKLPIIPDLVPSIGCGQICRLDAKVNDSEINEDGVHEWELEVLSEMVMKPNWIDVKFEVYATFHEDTSRKPDDTDSSIEATEMDTQPQILLPDILTCDYKSTEDICGPVLPQIHDQDQERTDGVVENDLHLVLLTHGVHGSWLDMLHLKEQIDAHNVKSGKTVTFLTDTNHSGTEEGIQLAGRRVASDILEFTGYYKTEEGKKLKKMDPAFTKAKSSGRASPIAKNRKVESIFPGGFSKVSIIGHSLGGLINIYALGYIEEITKGAFFKKIQPVHFIAVASPLLGVGFEHPWVLGTALSLGCIGQTGKDLALANRSHKSSTTHNESAESCSLDDSDEPLLLAMANPSSSSHKVLKAFQDRTLYANIENDMAVRFNTASMMGIPQFDIDHFFSPEGSAPTSRKNLFHSATVSVLALLFPKVPPKSKFKNIADAPSPISIISHTNSDFLETEEDKAISDSNGKSIEDNKKNSSDGRNSPNSSTPSKSISFRISQNSSNAKKLDSMSRSELANIISEDYHSDMDWTKIGVFIEHEAHVQIIVRRKWYNLDGWKSVQDLVERFNFQ